MLVISRNDNIIKFCIHTNIEFVQIPKINSTLSRKDIIKTKNLLLIKSNDFIDYNIFFSHNLFDYWGLFLIGKLSVNNNIYYYSTDPYYSNEYLFPSNFLNSSYLRLYLDSLILFYYLKIKFKVFFIANNQFCLGLPSKQLTKKYSVPNIQHNLLILIKNRHLINSSICINNNYDVLIVDSPLFCFSQHDHIYINIIEFLNSIGMRFIVKKHPNFNLSCDSLKSINNLPDFFPSELIDYSNFQFVIGNVSGSLLEISQEVDVISIFNLVNWDTQSYKDFVMDNFINNEIRTPNNISEIETIIRELLKLN
tara:strand:- start:10180 stop:11106 length:927 start_codon:yes stop_codon:yes gene_type:complete